MRTLALAAASLLALATAATAADLSMPYKAPPMAPIASGWTGFYLGLNAGGGIGLARSDFSVGGVNFATVRNTLPGPLAGVQAGYNWQMGPAVIGLEADYQLSNLAGGISAPCPIGLCNAAALTATYGQKVPWFGTVRGRLGFAQSGWLFYVTGGYSYARLETSAFAAAGGVSASFSQTETRSGWTVGTGIEVMLTGNWTARIEYLYLDLGTRGTSISFPALPLTIVDNARFDMHVTRLAVNYKF
jgi:outer membrane immunogenic protein